MENILAHASQNHARFLERRRFAATHEGQRARSRGRNATGDRRIHETDAQGRRCLADFT